MIFFCRSNQPSVMELIFYRQYWKIMNRIRFESNQILFIVSQNPVRKNKEFFNDKKLSM